MYTCAAYVVAHPEPADNPFGSVDNGLELQKISQFVCLVSAEPATYTPAESVV